MKLFLMIVAGFLVAMILFVVVLYLLIRWKIRTLGLNLGEALRAMEEHAAAAGIPPMRIELEDEDDLDWENEEQVQAMEEALRQAGFEHVQDYLVEMNLPVNLAAYVHPDKYAYAAIYEVTQIGAWLDVFTKYSDGSSCTYSTGKESGMDYPEGKGVVNLPNLNPPEVLQRFFAERAEKEMLPCVPEDFATRFEQEHAEEMDWRAERGAPTADEIRRASQIWGDQSESVSEDAIETIQEQWRQHFNDFWQEELRKNYMRSSGLNAAEWEEIEDRLFFVHDRMSPLQVAMLFEPMVNEMVYESDDGESDDEDSEHWESDAIEERIAELSAQVTSPAREAFAVLNESFPDKYRCVRHGETQQPVAADVWLLAKEY